MFHASGYDAVGLGALTDALGIKPPSFYAAFGSKVAFFERVLDLYARTVLPIDDVLREDRSAAEALTDLLERAARTYSRDPSRTGCLVLETARGNAADESVALARAVTEVRRARIRTFVARTHPDCARAVTDYVTTVMSGLSGRSREGLSQARLLAVARTAAVGLGALLA
ncbi:TetR/AcrR family transcriptional regulator [Pararobbsia silviterrae]|uniref:TetR/AcrR family transcriptional regulator n=2 Tax=Pararobbsia silviterrae TaxID=1792498 RepID=A0A494XFR9_9BURK|nr:TetR/AcrR family transcriptional regulator [Pararobbsia silviterrae]